MLKLLCLVAIGCCLVQTGTGQGGSCDYQTIRLDVSDNARTAASTPAGRSPAGIPGAAQFGRDFRPNGPNGGPPPGSPPGGPPGSPPGGPPITPGRKKRDAEEDVEVDEALVDTDLDKTLDRQKRQIAIPQPPQGFKEPMCRFRTFTFGWIFSFGRWRYFPRRHVHYYDCRNRRPCDLLNCAYPGGYRCRVQRHCHLAWGWVWSFPYCSTLRWCPRLHHVCYNVSCCCK